MTYIHRKVEDTAWALMYGFKLITSDRHG